MGTGNHWQECLLLNGQAEKERQEAERRQKAIEDANDARNHDIDTRKNIIGFWKKNKEEFGHEFIIQDFKETSTPAEIGNKLATEINRIINVLNIAFQLTDTSTATKIKLQQTRPQTNIDSESLIQIYFENVQDSMFLRLDKTIRNSENEKITWEIKNLNENIIESEDFQINNPWKNSFHDNLPLLTVPVNAGSEINAYLTNIGATSSLGLINDDGEILHPVKMTMRASKEETFYIYFYSPFNTPVKFAYPSYLYFHFEIQPLYEK